MSLGMIIDVLTIVVGGLLGTVCGRMFPERYREVLPQTFSIATFCMAVLSIVKVANLPAVILSLILGVIIGTGCGLEKRLRHAGEWTASLFVRGGEADPTVRARNLEYFAIAVILFCAGPTGIYGAIRTSVAGDDTLLLSKSVLDLFTAFIFAANAGVVIALLAAPMFLVYLFLSVASGSIAPLLTPAMVADFSGCGGLLILATGFRMAEIKMFRVTDMLPALLLVMPMSFAWTWLTGG